MKLPSVRSARKVPPPVRDPLKFISGLADIFARSYEVQSHPLVSKLLGNLRSRSFGTAVAVADEITSQSYGDGKTHFAMNQLACLVRKVPLTDASLDPIGTAWDKFLAAEHSCKRINQRLRGERSRGRERHSTIRAVARAWIVKVIGIKPNLSAIWDACDFGPGASYGVHGKATHKAAKLCSEAWTCTPVAQVYARAAMIGDDHIWELLQNERVPYCKDPDLFQAGFDAKVRVVSANKIIMVPKTAKVHRTIAIEPLLNGYVQKGIDIYLRGRLKRFGLDLTDQTRNQRLAKLGSEGGFNPFTTIDLSAASDSLSFETVKDLLPPEWFSLLADLRAPNYESDLGNGRYEKFVSMGNGFCFPLETLIFASLAYSVGTITGDTDFCVYGDDIIVHQSSALLLIEVLKYLGFSTNADKTFIIGPFRESCGADYFEGVNVRPYTLDFVPGSSRDLIKMANGIRENVFYSSLFAWEWIVSSIPLRDRLMRPCDGPPDTALNVPLDVFMSSGYARWCKGIQNWTWKELVDTAVEDPRRPPSSVQMYGLLRGQRSNAAGFPEFTFRRETRTRTRDVPSAPLRA